MVNWGMAAPVALTPLLLAKYPQEVHEPRNNASNLTIVCCHGQVQVPWKLIQGLTIAEILSEQDKFIWSPENTGSKLQVL